MARKVRLAGDEAKKQGLLQRAAAEIEMLQKNKIAKEDFGT